MKKSIIKGTFFREILTHRDLIIYKVRDYKQEGKDEVGCMKCGGLWKKTDMPCKASRRSDGTIYQFTYSCPTCKKEIGYEWAG